MALDPHYVLAPNLQTSFTDKTTGLPLNAGVITFYKDQARTILKPIYELTGAPPYSAASYIPLPNPLTLSSIGTMQDLAGNDIIPYYYPYDSAGGVELYYIEVKDSGGVLQFTREAWPNISSVVTPENVSQENLLPNGQFLIHDITPLSGLIAATVNPVAWGGWYYNRQTNTSVDYVTFPAYGSAITSPTGSPRFAAEIKNITPATDTFKYFGITFSDVNKFASSTLTPQPYTLTFTAKSNTGSSVVVPVLLNKYFGVSGSADTSVQIGSAIITSSYTVFKIVFTFGNNVGKVIGTDGGTVSLFLSLPSTYSFDVIVTDFVLAPGDVDIPEFPVTPDYEFQYQSLVPNIPDPTGNDLYLPLILTKTGLAYDHSVVGQVYHRVSATAPLGELLCDGMTYYAADYSSIGIPYKRLADVLWNPVLLLPNYGTGDIFLTCIFTSVWTNFNVAQNVPGVAAPITNGPAGFSPGLVITPVTPGIAVTGMYCGHENNVSYSIVSSVGACAIPGFGTTGFTVAVIKEGTALVQSVVSVTVPTLPAAGNYFEVSNTTTTYAVWFKVDGVGSAPTVPGATLIEADILSTYTTAAVAQLIGQVLSGYNVQNILFPAGSTISAGSYFNVYNTAGTHFVYYFTVAGAGTAPTVTGARIIAINILSTYTASDVSYATFVAINSTAFGTPDLRGDFIRIFDAGVGDDKGPRISWMNGPSGQNLGSLELEDFLSHAHTSSALSGALGTHGLGSSYQGGSGLDQNGSQTPTIYPSGGLETRPTNFNLQATIKY